MAKPLIETNPYLKDPEKRKSLFITTVSSSTAIEGVHTAVNELFNTFQSTTKPISASEQKKSGGSRR